MKLPLNLQRKIEAKQRKIERNKEKYKAATIAAPVWTKSFKLIANLGDDEEGKPIIKALAVGLKVTDLKFRNTWGSLQTVTGKIVGLHTTRYPDGTTSLSFSVDTVNGIGTSQFSTPRRKP